MIRRELAKDPKLANESWERFLPHFRKRHLTTAQKNAKKREAADRSVKIQAEVQANALAHPGPSTLDGKPAVLPPARLSKDKSKKIYTPFPPPQLPRKVRHPERTMPQSLNCVWNHFRLIFNSRPESFS